MKTKITSLFFLLLIASSQITLADDDTSLNMHFFSEQQFEKKTVSDEAKENRLPSPPIKASDTTLEKELVDSEEPDIHMVFYNADEEQITEPDNYVSVKDDFSFFYYLESGYQHDSFKWDIAGPNGNPDTLTEVEWNDLSLVGFNAGFNVPILYNFILKADAGYAWTVAGNSQQTSFLHDGKTDPFTSVENDSGEGYAWFGSIALGYAFDFGSKFNDPVALNITPLAGYSWREQNLKADNGHELLTGFERNDPSTLGLENSYSANWSGPWLGGDITLSAFRHHQLFSSFQHHWAEYEAEGDWRQSEDVQKSTGFEHSADATGIVASAGYRYIKHDSWGLSLSVDYQKWDADSGTEILFTTQGARVNSWLNDVERESLGVNLGINMNY